MKNKGKILGKGIDALFQDLASLEEVDVKKESVIEISLNELRPNPYQPRKTFDENSLKELASSIAHSGVFQPIIVRESAVKGYEIIAGERRWRAAQLAGLTQIPAIVRELNDQVAIALALIENIQRQDLNPIDQAVALQRFHDEFGLSHQEIADTVGKARTTVSNLLRLLSLADPIKDLMQQGQIDMGHARAILTLKAKDQIDVAQIVIEKALSVRQTEQLVREWSEPKPEKEKVQVSPDIEQLTQKLSERFGANVKIDHNQKGKGKMVIHYHSLDELDGILNICLPN